MSASSKFTDALLELAWSQWTVLGVAGVVSYADVAIGLEELLIFTGTLTEADPRLCDEALDWCCQHGRMISKPRLKTLLAASSASSREAFAPFAATYNSLAKFSWPGAGNAQKFSIRLSGKSRLEDLTAPALINLRVRSLFGVGARADVLTTLLGSQAPNWSAPDLAYVGYTRRNIAQVLEDLSTAGLLRPRRVRNQVRFEWVRRKQLEALVHPLPTSFPRWPDLMRLLSSIHELLLTMKAANPTVAGIEARKLLSLSEPELAVLGIEPPKLTNRPTEAWTTFQAWALALSESIARGEF